MLLFLDLDGVLHPFIRRADWPHEESEPFALLPRLLSVIDDFPQVDVVISSSWRLIEGALETELPDALRRRVIGCTPEIRRPVRSYYPAGYTPEPVRFLEIEKYLRNCEQPDRPWVALDDDPSLFPVGCPQLILCPRGFREAEAAELRRRFGRNC